MYRTKIYWPENSEEVTNLQLASSSTTRVSVDITYASEAAMSGGAPVLVDPITRTFNQSSLSTLRGYYIVLNGVVYYIPSDATVSRVSSSGTYVWRASTAQKLINAALTLYSGVGERNAVSSCKITYASNDGDDLMLGSVCAACLEVKIISRDGDLSISTGAEVTVYKVADDDTETQIGVFNVETPTQVSEHIYKITAYDNVRKLDVDMTDWLRSLTGWPYSLTAFYQMICTECGLTGGYNTWAGASDFMVYQFDVEKNVTGRQLVSWCAEAMGNYCIALPSGALFCNWYRTSYFYLYPSEKSMPNGHEGLKQIYYQGTLSYEDFEVQDVNIVQLRKDDSEDAELWPDYSNLSGVDKTNPYIITGNPILLSHPTYLTTSTAADSVRTALEKIADRFDYNVYRPYKVEIPEFLEAQIGRYAFIACAEGQFIAPIASLVWTGHKMTLECTAKRTRDNADSPEYKTNKQLMEYSDQTAKKAASAATANLVEYDKICSDCNTAITPGLYYLSGANCINYPSKIPSGNYGVMLVQRRYGEVYQQVRYGDYIAFRRSVRDESNVSVVASWKDWIVINLTTLASMASASAAAEEELM